jgi:Ca-activated chloride channel family protein
MKMKAPGIVGVCAAVLLIHALWSSAVPIHAQDPTFRAGADLVRVTVTVTDRGGGSIAGLRKEDFAIEEDGRAQDIALFQRDEDTPFSVAIALDTSGSMEDKLDDAQDAVVHFVAQTRETDEVWAFTFSYAVNRIATPEDSRERVLREIRRLQANGGTALYDAVVEGVGALTGSERDKKVLLLITDGNDTASRRSRRDAQNRLQRSDVIMYALGIGHGERGSFGHGSLDLNDRVDIETLRSLAEPTGGRAFELEQAHRDGQDLIDRAVSDVARELREQYTIGYYPPAEGRDGFHKIKVTTRNRDVRVRARDGYWRGR